MPPRPPWPPEGGHHDTRPAAGCPTSGGCGNSWHPAACSAPPTWSRCWPNAASPCPRSRSWRLVAKVPERLSLQLLAALCDIFEVTPAELITTTAGNIEPRKAASGGLARGAGPGRAAAPAGPAAAQPVTAERGAPRIICARCGQDRAYGVRSSPKGRSAPDACNGRLRPGAPAPAAARTACCSMPRRRRGAHLRPVRRDDPPVRLQAVRRRALPR